MIRAGFQHCLYVTRIIFVIKILRQREKSDKFFKIIHTEIFVAIKHERKSIFWSQDFNKMPKNRIPTLKINFTP